MNTFTPFPKTPRLLGTMTITEKIDGANTAVVVTAEGEVVAQSRRRLITPEDDHFGFAQWVRQHEDELRDGLGRGVHFGEWWGSGIQRGYGLKVRRFSLFNVHRWHAGWTEMTDEGAVVNEPPTLPPCCHVVPVLYRGPFSTVQAVRTLEALMQSGSVAAPGFGRPEGVMVWHDRARRLFKLPFDPAPKGAAS